MCGGDREGCFDQPQQASPPSSLSAASSSVWAMGARGGGRHGANAS